MDQDAFRELLQSSKPSGSSGKFSASRNVFAKKPSTSKVQTISASEPAFKPRKVKKNDAKYRDRASERREGAEGDYAQVEAVLEDFEKRNADVKDKAALDERRKYLGGDGEHTVLVKGLDFALLEQYKAREAAAANEDDDDLLDEALKGVPSAPENSTPASGSKKRTREDLIRQLKSKRAGGDTGEADAGDAPAVEDTTRSGKFKPIGAPQEPVKKKKKVREGDKDGSEQKKKKRKVAEEGASVVPTKVAEAESNHLPSESPAQIAQTKEPELELLADDFDIFAGAGEYEGFADEDDEDEEGELEARPQPPKQSLSPSPESTSAPPRRWIDTEEPGEVEESKPGLLSSILKSKFDAKPKDPSQALDTEMPSRVQDEDADNGMDEDIPMKLQPLAGSGPSVRELLDMDKASGKKWKKRDKKKGSGGDGNGTEKKQNAEAKAERDYNRLKKYTDSKQ